MYARLALSKDVTVTSTNKRLLKKIGVFTQLCKGLYDLPRVSPLSTQFPCPTANDGVPDSKRVLSICFGALHDCGTIRLRSIAVWQMGRAKSSF